MPVQTTYSLPLTVSPIQVGGGDTYWPTNGAWFNTKGAYTIIFSSRRTAQAGTTATFQVFPQYLYEPTNTFYDLRDYAGAQISNVLIATTVFDTTPRLLILGYDLPPGATVGKLNFNTIDQAYQTWLPEKLRFRFNNAGTGNVQNTVSAQMQIHTRI